MTIGVAGLILELIERDSPRDDCLGLGCARNRAQRLRNICLRLGLRNGAGDTKLKDLERSIEQMNLLPGKGGKVDQQVGALGWR